MARRQGGSNGSILDGIHFGNLDIGEDPRVILLVIAVVAVLGLLFFFGIPLLVFLLDIILIVLLVLGGIVARVLFRRPWLVEATDGTQSRHWDVVGWRASGNAIAQIEAALRNGRPLPATFVRDKAAGPFS